ncbi:unnamed protein product [Ambrosiozyma monospora]|uniref:Unnamed protein product n=1 Tax=Ambrosiozyma monospora TaxID=43982 RepID=A0ACB5TCB4_AMBMO|nr:unnamed protein product [Ambrosiozyma monospora]
MPQKRKLRKCFTLTLTLLEMAICSEPVDIPEDPSFEFKFSSDMEPKKLIMSLKNMYYTKVKPKQRGIHQTFLKLFQIKH